MSNSERKGNLAKTTTGNPQWQPPGHSEQQLVPSTSSERVPRSSAEVQCKLFACTLINTNDQRSKQIAGQSPPLVFSTPRQRSSAETQSNASGGKSYAATLRSTPDNHWNQNQGQLQPPTSRQCSSAEIQSNAGAGKSYASLKNNPDQRSTQTPVLSAQSNSPTPRGTVQDQTNANIKKLASTEFVDCGTGSTAAAAAKNSSQGKRNKLAGVYQHGSFLNKSSGNQDDPLDVTGTSSKSSTGLRSTLDHGGSHSPGVDTEESKTEKPFRSCKEVDDVLQGAKHSSGTQEQHGNKQVTDCKGLDTKQSSYGTTNKMSQVDLNSAKSAEEARLMDNNARQNKEISELSAKYIQITGKQPQISTTLNKSPPTSVTKQTQCSSAQVVCSQNNNHEGKSETNCLNVKDNTADKMEIVKCSAHGNLLSAQTTQKSSLCNAYFNKTLTGTSSTTGYTVAIGRNSDVSCDNHPQDVRSAVDSGEKNNAKELNDPCKVDTDFDHTKIEIPKYFHKKAEKEKDPATYLKGVFTSVQGVVLPLFKGSKQAEGLLTKSQNLQLASENSDQLISEYQHLHGKILPDIESAIKKWNHPPYNEQLDKFKTYLESINACLQTCCKIIEIKVKHMCAEAKQLKSRSYKTIEPLPELRDMKTQIEKLGQQLVEIPKLENIKKSLEEISENLRLANENTKKNIHLLTDMEKKYAATENFLNMDLKNVKRSETELLLSQLDMAKKDLIGLNLLGYKNELVKKYQDALHILKNKELILRGKHLEFIAQKEFEGLTSLAKDLKTQANNKDNRLESATVESALKKFHTFLTSLVHCIPETDKKSAKETIAKHEDALKKILGILKAVETLKAMDANLKSLVKLSTNFSGPLSELQKLVTQLENHLHQYKLFSSCEQETIQTKVNSSISSLQTCIESLKLKKTEIEANEKFEKSCFETSTLLKDVDDFWGPSDQTEKLFCKLIEAANLYFDFECMGNKNHENNIKQMQTKIVAAQDTLKSRQPQIEAQEIFKKSYSLTSTILKEVNNFCGPSSDTKNLIQKLSDELKYYLGFQHMGNEILQGKLINVQGEIFAACDSLKLLQPIIEARESLDNIQRQAEELQRKVFKGDMSCLRNYMREVEKLQSDLSAFKTQGNDRLKKEAESVSQAIRSTLVHLEGIELQLENEMSESMAVEEYAEKQSPDLAHHLEESLNMKWICNIAMQLMSIYRQLSNNDINIMDSNQLKWLEVRNGELERMLVNDIKPQTAHEIKTVSQAKRLCIQIQESIANNKQCEAFFPELNEIRATGMRALEYHTKIFKGDIRYNQIRWLEEQLIECQTKLDRLELPEGVARESRKDVLNLCNQALSALKKHSYCKD